jgi:hypothetical protein
VWRTTSAKSTAEWAVSTTAASCVARRAGDKAVERSLLPASSTAGTNGSWYLDLGAVPGEALEDEERRRLANPEADHSVSEDGYDAVSVA